MAHASLAPLVLVFHALYPDAQSRAVDRSRLPFEGLTVKDLRKVLHHLVSAGYRFVTPAQFAHSPLQPGTVLLTADDGYANTQLALPVLEEFEAPLVLFVASSYTEAPRRFWWDVIYSRARARGQSHRGAYASVLRHQQKDPHEVERSLLSQGTEASLAPLGPHDSPFSAEALRVFAAHPLVHLALHTHTHPYLPTLGPEQVTEELTQNQASLSGLSEQVLPWLAYPFGVFDERQFPALRQWGVQLAFGANALWARRTNQQLRHPLSIPRYAPVAGASSAAALRWLAEPTPWRYYAWYLRRRTELALTRR